MKPKHTPSPWNVGVLSIPGFQRAYQLNATVQTKRDVDVDIANARLIAAAPEMLEALELLVREVTVLPGTGKQDGNIGHRHINAALAALAKARGEPAKLTMVDWLKSLAKESLEKEAKDQKESKE